MNECNKFDFDRWWESLVFVVEVLGGKITYLAMIETNYGAFWSHPNIIS